MDKILSTRVDESIIQRINVLARQLGTTKRAVVEGAIRLYAATVDEQENCDVFKQTSGAWKRDESGGPDYLGARRIFQESMGRHQP